MSTVDPSGGASGSEDVFANQTSSNPEVVMFLAEMDRMSIEGDTISAYYSNINNLNNEMTQMDDLLEELDNDEAECSGTNGTVTVSSSLSSSLSEYGIDISGSQNSTQLSDAAESLEQEIDDVSTQSSESMDEMELITNNYETDAQTASDFISGMATTLQTEASNMK